MMQASSSNLEAKVFRRLADETDKFEKYSNAHGARIATIATEIGKQFSLASKDLQSLRTAAYLHDLGEATMARDYIERAGALSVDERLDLQRHPIIGEQETARSGGDRAAQLMVRWHHEWWNGTGYPDSLQREQIPLAARIIRVADSYAALTDARPYRQAMDKNAAREHMAEWAGIEFDPRVVEVLLSLAPFTELESLAVITEVTDAPPPELEWKTLSSFSG